MNNLGQKFGGDWTEQKLDCVSKYLNAYTQIMNHREFDFFVNEQETMSCGV